MAVVFDEVEGTVASGTEERSAPNEAQGPTEATSPARILDEFRKLEQREARLHAD
jgi:hypothetical protein